MKSKSRHSTPPDTSTIGRSQSERATSGSCSKSRRGRERREWKPYDSPMARCGAQQRSRDERCDQDTPTRERVPAVRPDVIAEEMGHWEFLCRKSSGTSSFEDATCLLPRELRSTRLNLGHSYITGRETQRKRMPTWDDPRPPVLSTRNEHHGAGFRKVALNLHGSTNRSKTGDEAVGVVHGKVEARLQGLRIQARLFEGCPKRGRRWRIEPQEGEHGVMRGRPTTRTSGRP